MSDITSVLHGLRHLDDDERALAALPLLADRMKYHAKRLPQVQHIEGTEGLRRYRARWPEAASIYVHTPWPTASLSKPRGYDAFLCNLVRRWFASDIALSETNRAAVGQMNVALQDAQFDPDRHFSTGLSAGRLEKIAEVFSDHGARLDTKKPKITMSDVRAAVKVAKGRRSEGQPFGKVGCISGNQLITGSRSITIMQHHGHPSIKVTVGGKRIWLRLDVAAEFVALMGLVSGGDPVEDDPDNLLIEDIREMVPDAENDEFDPLVDVLEQQSSGELVPILDPPPHSHRDMVPPDSDPVHSLAEMVPANPPSLSEAMAARRSARLVAALMDQSDSPACPVDPDADPLAF